MKKKKIEKKAGIHVVSQESIVVNSGIVIPAGCPGVIFKKSHRRNESVILVNFYFYDRHILAIAKKNQVAICEDLSKMEA